MPSMETVIERRSARWSYALSERARILQLPGVAQSLHPGLSPLTPSAYLALSDPVSGSSAPKYCLPLTAYRLPVAAHSSLASQQTLHPSVPALAASKFGDGFAKVISLKIGPERLGHVHFRIAQLPEEEIGNAHLAGGPYQ
jgi:hypothetical protein